MLAGVALPTLSTLHQTQATKIALELKKRLVDQSKLDISQARSGGTLALMRIHLTAVTPTHGMGLLCAHALRHWMMRQYQIQRPFAARANKFQSFE
jgi:hypothetical protein